jgi:hypothetical protein
MEEERNAVRRESPDSLRTKASPTATRTSTPQSATSSGRASRIRDQDSLLEDLKAKKVVKYFKVVPQQVHPWAHGAGAGTGEGCEGRQVHHPAIELKTATNLAVR